MKEKVFLTLIGIAVAVAVSIYRRDKKSTNTPEHLDVLFYIKDNFVSHLISALISILLVVSYHLLDFDVYLFEKISDPQLYTVFERSCAWLCGYAPHHIVSQIDSRTKLFKFKQIDHAGKTYNRK